MMSKTNLLNLNVLIQLTILLSALCAMPSTSFAQFSADEEEHEVIPVWGWRIDGDANEGSISFPPDLGPILNPGPVTTGGSGGHSGSDDEREPRTEEEKKKANKKAKSKIAKLFERWTPGGIAKEIVKDTVNEINIIDYDMQWQIITTTDSQGNRTERVVPKSTKCFGFGREAIEACLLIKAQKSQIGDVKLTFVPLLPAMKDGEEITVSLEDDKSTFYFNRHTGDEVMQMLGEVLGGPVQINVPCPNGAQHGERYEAYTNNGSEVNVCKYGRGVAIDYICDSGYSDRENIHGIRGCYPSHCDLGGLNGILRHDTNTIVEEGRCVRSRRSVTRASCSFGQISYDYDSVGCSGDEIVTGPDFEG